MAKKKQAEHTLPTVEAIAEWLALPFHTVQKWPSKFPGKIGKPGAWSVREFARLAIQIARERNKGAFADEDGVSVKDKIALAELELTREKAREKARENRIAEGELLSRDDVEQWVAAAGTALRETIMAIPDAVARSMPPDSREFVRSETGRLCRDALIAYRDALKKHEHNSDPVDRPADSAGGSEQPRLATDEHPDAGGN